MKRKFHFNRNRLIRFIGEINEDMVQEFLKALGEFEEESKKQAVQIVMNTGGGETDSALGAYDALIFFSFPIITVVEGKVASSGVPIFLAGRRRYITRNSHILIHKPRGSGIDGLTHEELAFIASDIRQTEDVFIRIISERTGQNIKKVREDLRMGKIFNAEEAVAYGFAHEVI